jgi:NADH-quinone oxidoreductase subunit J
MQDRFEGPDEGRRDMTLFVAFFYLFAVLAVAAATMVIVAKNPVHAVLFLILTFFNAAGLFILLGAEFLAMLLVIVYVGAVAVLFLFVVMMLDVDFAELKAGFIKNAPVGLFVGGIVLAELVLLFLARGFGLGTAKTLAAAAPAGLSNTEALGRIIYTQYVYFFEAAGLILLVAMIGAIVLTLRHKEGVKRQSIAAQVARGPKTAIEVVKVAAGTAVIPAGETSG